MDYTIDDDIPPPPDNTRRKYPFKQMKVGQSIFVAGEADGRRAAGASRMGQSGKFRARRVVENGIEGTRIWKVE